ncbi:hypothetical protein [Streptomyces lydicus]|uniref:hypothetical protein n=1 Tax=Streptomyces lydicus TaxID=47763 RepID=UPI0010127D2E|nr:hypothetical protein [Streptomyces lydicus]MCZ1011083.1 hypothetical protein [Streptomyces lydicus]
MGILLAVVYIAVGIAVLFDAGGLIHRRCERVQKKAAERHREMLWANGRLETPYVPVPFARPGLLRAMGLPIALLGGLLLLLHLD